MRTKLLTGVAIGVVVVLLTAWAASPVLAGQALIRAARTGDERALERLVDFPSLRASLKQEINEELASRFRRDPRVADSGLGGLGLILAPMLMSGAVDAVVTPQGVAAMVRTGEAPDPANRTPADKADKDHRDDIHQSWGYRGFDTFAITLTRRDDPERHLALLLDRRGLFGWKLAAIDLQTDPPIE